ncbi:MAG TPA: AAA family ATPase [Acidimicrobiales bacterium]|nr:AAA family ATPase [Acidimicrobiales bacterium]
MSEEITATFIFTDLVDSTALASRVGPDKAEQIRTAHFGALRGAIDSFGGTEVKNLGDGLMVMFTSARRAVSCAVAMQQAIESHNRRAQERLSIRVGIAVGEATLEDADYFGTPVIEAARLCAQCDDDQILVTATVLTLVGSGLTLETRDLGGIELKGLPEPVGTVEILWEPDAASSDSVALPSRVASVLTGAALGFFGRTEELAVIAEAAKTARGAQCPQLVAIAGEPGMGKTTLAAHSGHDLAGTGEAIVAFGGCTEGLSVPFQPWIEAVRGLVDTWDTPTLDAHVAARGHTLGTWVPELAAGDGAPVASSDAASDQLVLFAAVTDVLARSADDRLLVMILDDLQWSDAASIQLLRHVLTRELAKPVLVVATYRDSDLTSGDSLTGFLADMRREPNVTRIDLDGFSDTEVVEVMEAAAGHDLTEPGIALAHALRRETRGNPFFTGAMLRHLVDNGLVAQSAAGRVEVTGSLHELGLPSSVREVVAHRVDRLGDDTVTVLNAAAVIGLRFDFELLVDLVELSEDTVLDVLEEATAAALVEEDQNRPGQFGFVHGLVRDTLYTEISATRRQRTHRRIAEALEDRPDLAEPTLLATHFIAASRPHDVDRAVQYAAKAGDAAMAAFAPADAVAWYGQALELHLGDADADLGIQCDLQTKLGHTMRNAGDPTHQDLLFATAELAERLGDPDRSIAVALALTENGTASKPEDPDRRALVERALALVDGTDAANRVKLLLALAAETDRNLTDRRRTLITGAVEEARRSRDDRLWVLAHSQLYLVNQPADHERLLDETETTLDIATALGDRTLEFHALASRMNELALAGRTAERTELCERARRLLGDSGTAQQRHTLRQALVTLMCYRGEVDDAEALVTSGYSEASQAGLDDALVRYASQLFVIRELQGRLDELVDLFVDVAKDGSAPAAAYAAAAFMLCHLGRVDEARKVVPITIEFLEAIPEDVTWTTALRCAAYVASAMDDTVTAAWVYDRLLPYRHLFAHTNVTTTTSLELPLGLAARTLGHTDDAVSHFRSAVNANRSAGALFWTTESQIELAETLSMRGGPGDATEAAELSAAAAECARTYGFADLDRRIGALG